MTTERNDSDMCTFVPGQSVVWTTPIVKTRITCTVLDYAKGWYTLSPINGEAVVRVLAAEVSAAYEPPTIEEWHEIVRAMKYYGLDAHLEGGGAATTYVWIDRLDGRVVLVGDQDETWCGNVYASQEAFENGEEFTTFGTDVPTKFDGTDRYHDPESIAEAVFTALRSC